MLQMPQALQVPVGLIAQLVEHCTGIAEVMGSNPVQALKISRLSFRDCISCVHNRDGLSLINFFYPQFKQNGFRISHFQSNLNMDPF